MANLSKDLKNIFNKYLERKEKERLHPTVSQPNLFGGNRGYTGIIYFYEWSDVTRTPKSFYSLEKFEDFLESCNICLMGYQREIINNIHNPYVTCKKGTKELLIKVSYDALKNAVNIPTPEVNNFMAKGSEDKEPYQVAVTRPPIQRPPMYEPEGRWQDENEFQWYG
jgi:hypothetical protein